LAIVALSIAFLKDGARHENLARIVASESRSRQFFVLSVLTIFLLTGRGAAKDCCRQWNPWLKTGWNKASDPTEK
jgi:hypothetical protein